MFSALNTAIRRESPSVGDIMSVMFPDNNPQLNQSQVETTCWEQLQLLPTEQQCVVLSQLFVMFLKQSTIVK